MFHSRSAHLVNEKNSTLELQTRHHDSIVIMLPCMRFTKQLQKKCKICFTIIWKCAPQSMWSPCRKVHTVVVKL
jgi:hypothetical protein